MNNEIKEIKIGMYTTDEILEFMTNGEGRGFMGRSMYDAILDYITNLQEENKKLDYTLTEYTQNYLELQQRIDKAIEIIKLCNSKCAKEVINILQGGDKE